MSQLHSHIQDVFNENGVQIMSPHYMADPRAAAGGGAGALGARSRAGGTAAERRVSVTQRVG